MEKSSDLYLFQDTRMTFTANHYSKGHSVMLDDLCNTYSILIENRDCFEPKFDHILI